jgi:ribonuclease-3
VGAAWNYAFVDSDLERLALTHRSSARINNERLEFLGDAVLGQIIGEYLFRKFPNADEGQLTRIRATLVNKETLADVARSIDLGEHIVLGEGELKSGGWRRDSILANTLEALIGAIYLDGGLAACTDQISIWFATVLRDIDPSINRKDAKTRLQEFLQAQGNPLPTYNAAEVTGPAHDQRFTIQCQVESQSGVVSAVGKSRRIAEQKAAALMLEKLEGDAP